MKEITRLLLFDVKGKFGHFKKYYTNVSSLTYEVPPRTVLIGMIASILGNYQRDSYYEDLHPAKSKVSACLQSKIRKHIQCMNYRKKNGGVTQVRLELLLPAEKNIVFRVYFWHENDELMDILKEKLIKSYSGYGIYFGQRQFRASANFVKEYEADEIKMINNSNFIPLSSLTYRDNKLELDTEKDFELVEISMPCHMKKIKNGREQAEMVNVIYEKNGKPLFGKFKEILRVGNENIAFFTPMDR